MWKMELLETRFTKEAKCQRHGPPDFDFSAPVSRSFIKSPCPLAVLLGWILDRLSHNPESQTCQFQLDPLDGAKLTGPISSELGKR
jgi:hypothetical protein